MPLITLSLHTFHEPYDMLHIICNILYDGKYLKKSDKLNAFSLSEHRDSNTGK